MADISINWADLGKVAGVSLAFSLGIAIVFAIGVLGLSRVEAGRARSGSPAASYTLAGVCFAACAAAALYGIYLIVPQFH